MAVGLRPRRVRDWGDGEEGVGGGFRVRRRGSPANRGMTGTGGAQLLAASGSSPEPVSLLTCRPLKNPSDLALMDDTHQDWGDEESSDAKRFRVRRGSTSNRTAGGGGGAIPRRRPPVGGGGSKGCHNERKKKLPPPCLCG